MDEDQLEEAAVIQGYDCHLQELGIVGIVYRARGWFRNFQVGWR
jgi:hypothetical protein